MKDSKMAKLILTAGGAALCILLAMKFHKSILQKFNSLRNRNRIAAELKVNIINDEAKCKEIIAALRR